MKKMSDIQTEKLLKKHKIPYPQQVIAKTPEAAVKAAGIMGYPVVLKVSSQDIVHKTDAGGIIVGVTDSQSVEAGFYKILKNARKYKSGARIDGILVQKQVDAKGARELIIGSKKDPQFGPVIMFGLGGIFVEVLKDVSFRLIPLSRKDAREMMHEIKGYKILEGVRGEKPVNFKALEDMILKVSDLIEKNPEIEELDVNPLFANEKETIAADVRILVK